MSKEPGAVQPRFEASVRDVFAGFPIIGSPNESQTDDDLNQACSGAPLVDGESTPAEPLCFFDRHPASCPSLRSVVML